MYWKTQFNAQTFPRGYRAFTQPSMTVPDQAMKISEMIARFTMGLSVRGARVPIYEGDSEFYPDLNTMDLVDRDEYVQQSKERLDQYKEQQKQKQKAQQDAFDKKLSDEIKRQAAGHQSLNPVQ